MKKLLVGAAIAACALGAYKWTKSDSKTTDETIVASDQKLVLDRLWIDHIPKTERDPFKIFAALTDDPIGIFQTLTMWTGQYEIFQYEAHDNEIRAVFPQNRDREKMIVKGTRCNEGGFDYCLEISGSSRGAKKYYSMKGWELDGLKTTDAVDAKIKSLVHSAPDVE